MVSKNPHHEVRERLGVTFADGSFAIAFTVPMNPFLTLLFLGGSLFQYLIRRNAYYPSLVS